MLARLIPAIVAMSVLCACENKVPEPTGPSPKPRPAAPAKVAPKTLVKEDVVTGTGPVAEKGDTVKVHYTGRLFKNNNKFDSSVGKDPFSFTIGKGGVIKGWDQGVPGMKVGGKRKLTIPSDLAYGAKGSGKIPADSALVFDIELLGIDGKEAAPVASAAASGAASAAPAASAKP